MQDINMQTARLLITWIYKHLHSLHLLGDKRMKCKEAAGLPVSNPKSILKTDNGLKILLQWQPFGWSPVLRHSSAE